MRVRSGLLHTLSSCPRCDGLPAPGRPRCAKCSSFLSIYDPYPARPWSKLAWKCSCDSTPLSVDDPFPAVPAVAIEDLLGVIDARIVELYTERPSDPLACMTMAARIYELNVIRQIIEGAQYD